ncbi:MAG: hypothetical protein NC184_07235 [Roseburia sp.]|nr:hypothetical protein [Roseburia sp.]
MKKTDKSVQDARPVYILCPRCEINYINAKDKYCAVCKAELGIGDRSILLPEEDEAQDERICPVCRVNLLNEDEDICIECKKEREEKEKEVSEDLSDEENSDWDPFNDEEDEEEIPDGMQEMLIDDEEEEEEEEEEEVETVSDEPDDFDFNVDPNDFVDDDEEDEE